jgi:hypothetical protein
MNDIYNGRTLTVTLKKKHFQEVPIYRATKDFVSLQILQVVSVIWELLRYLEGANPKGFKFSMLSFVLLGHIPFEYQISQLEILLISFLVKGLLDFLLSVMRFVHNMLSFLLHFYHLMNSSDHVIRIFLVVLEELHYRQGEM